MVLASSTDLFGDVRRALVPDGRFVDGGDVIHCDGGAAPLTNIYAADLDPHDMAGLDVPEVMPDPREMSTLILECRSPEWIAEIGRMLARGLDEAIWFLDSADVVWPADRIEPDQLALA